MVVSLSSLATILGKQCSTLPALFFFLSGYQLVHNSSALYARISPQWLSQLRLLWPMFPDKLRVSSFPTLCMGSGIVSPLRFHWVKGVYVFRCNMPPALLAEQPGSFTCHCGNTGVERTPIKSQHTKLILGQKSLPPLLPGFELETFRSRVRRFYQQAIPAPL